jgi:lipopolysaccharide export system protein LptA
MWTPRRIVMLSGCFLAFFLMYLGYAYSSVGRMNGLPPLPEAFWPPEDGEVITGPPPRDPGQGLAKKIKMAFGPDCEELKRPIRLDLQSKDMVLCAGRFVVDEGRVMLEPVSVAVFGKDKGDGRPVEINTIKGKIAWLDFNRPVTTFGDIGSRTITKAEIHSYIEVRNNRRRAERDEDLFLQINTGPLYYTEATHRVWTHDHIWLTDYKSKPRPHIIKGKGMEMDLHVEESDPRKPAKGNKPTSAKGSVSGVNWVMLHADVDMELHIDGKSGLLTTAGPPKQAAPGKPAGKEPPKAEEKAKLLIRSPGPFRYDIRKDHDLAQFDATPAAAAGPMRQAHHVVATRINETTGARDELVCKHLTLRLHRRDATAEKGPAVKHADKAEEKAGENVEIETVHATSPTREVVLTSDTEKLIARGNDFFHDAIKGLTIMKGEPEVDVEKDSSRIFARELHLQDVKPPAEPGKPAPKPYQHVIAHGPGRIHMVDKAGKKTNHAYWDKLLVSTKDNGEDLLTLTGNARFVEEETGQSLKADLLKVWMEEADKSQPAADTTAGRKPRHLEAIGAVVARSREINIHDTGRLVAWFKDVPASTHLPPGAPAPKPGAAAEPAKPADKRPAATPIPAGKSAPPAARSGSEEVKPREPQKMPEGPKTPQRLTSTQGGEGPELGAADNRPPPRPFDLTARSVEAKILRSPIKNSIDELWCEGKVRVLQEPARAEEKGTDVKGDTLKMTARGLDLFYLVVTGDLAELQTDKIYILGPEINIDQSTNKAWVYGDGCMKMDSATNFQGEKLDRPVPLTVHWHKSMLFNGASARFHGNIQGVQEKARLACQQLHVFFDRTISLKEGNKSDDPAKVREMVCDRDVRIEDSTYDGDVLVKYQRLVSPGVQMIALEPDEEAEQGKVAPRGTPPGPAGKSDKAKPAGKTSAGNQVFASGPGNVRILQPESDDEGGQPGLGSRVPGAAPAPAPGAKPAPDRHAGKHAKGGKTVMKMTYVEFRQRMDANSKTSTAKFWKDVRVLNLPCKDPDMKIDLDAMLAGDLPEGSFYMRCDRMKVLDAPTGGQPNKQMEGHGQVYCQGSDFYARADMVTYNEQKSQVIFYGIDSYATLYKVTAKGATPSVVEGKKIIYNEKTKETQVIGTRSFSGESMAPAKSAPPPAAPGSLPTPARPGTIQPRPGSAPAPR